MLSDQEDHRDHVQEAWMDHDRETTPNPLEDQESLAPDSGGYVGATWDQHEDC